MPKIIQRGAEAVLILDGKKLIKQRIEKHYRLKEIDSNLRKSRTKKETILLKQFNFTPTVFNSDKYNIEMEFLEGNLLKDILDNLDKKNREKICIKIGRQIAELHDKNVIHGDLTTSNMILRDDKVYFIDFGLGFVSQKIEDKAVDIHLLRHALESKHYRICNECFDKVIEGYKQSKTYKEVLKKLSKVELRGRYKRKK